MTELPFCVKVAQLNDSGAFLADFAANSILPHARFAAERRLGCAPIGIGPASENSSGVKDRSRRPS
jgi:hypothetical protein